jgi:hypothetical protein
VAFVDGVYVSIYVEDEKDDEKGTRERFQNEKIHVLHAELKRCHTKFIYFY